MKIRSSILFILVISLFVQLPLTAMDYLRKGIDVTKEKAEKATTLLKQNSQQIDLNKIYTETVRRLITAYESAKEMGKRAIELQNALGCMDRGNCSSQVIEDVNRAMAQVYTALGTISSAFAFGLMQEQAQQVREQLGDMLGAGQSKLMKAVAAAREKFNGIRSFGNRLVSGTLEPAEKAQLVKAIKIFIATAAVIVVVVGTVLFAKGVMDRKGKIKEEETPPALPWRAPIKGEQGYEEYMKLTSRPLPSVPESANKKALPSLPAVPSGSAKITKPLPATPSKKLPPLPELPIPSAETLTPLPPIETMSDIPNEPWAISLPAPVIQQYESRPAQRSSLLGEIEQGTRLRPASERVAKPAPQKSSRESTLEQIKAGNFTLRKPEQRSRRELSIAPTEQEKTFQNFQQQMTKRRAATEEELSEAEDEENQAEQEEETENAPPLPWRPNPGRKKAPASVTKIASKPAASTERSSLLESIQAGTTLRPVRDVAKKTEPVPVSSASAPRNLMERVQSGQFAQENDQNEDENGEWGEEEVVPLSPAEKLKEQIAYLEKEIRKIMIAIAAAKDELNRCDNKTGPEKSSCEKKSGQNLKKLEIRHKQLEKDIKVQRAAVAA